MAIYHEDECYELGTKVAEALNAGQRSKAERFKDRFREVRNSLGEAGAAARISLNGCYYKGYADHRIG